MPTSCPALKHGLYALRQDDPRPAIKMPPDAFYDPNPDHEPHGEYDEDGDVFKGLLVALLAIGLGVVASYLLWTHREAVMHFWRAF